MARTTATNYTGTSTGGYPYATAPTDPFSKADVQDLAQSVNEHDHSSGKGVAVERIGTGVVTAANLKQTAASEAVITAAIRDLAVTTAKIADLAVTSGKIAAGAINAAALDTTIVPNKLLSNVFVPEDADDKNTFKRKLVVTADGGTPGILDLSDAILYQDTGATVASAASITLGADGNTFVISGTTQITTITIKPTGTVVHLRFSSAACKVNTGGNINVRGVFTSGAGGSSHLSLLSDGVSWHEIGRAAPPMIVRYYLFADQAVSSNGVGEVVGHTASGGTWVLDGDFANNIGIVYDSGDGGFTLPAGYWRVSAIVQWETENADNRQIWITKNGATSHRLLSEMGSANNNSTTQGGTDILYANGTDEYFLRAQQESGSVLNVEGNEVYATSITWEYLGA